MIKTENPTYSSLKIKYIDRVIFKKRREMFEVKKDN